MTKPSRILARRAVAEAEAELKKRTAALATAIAAWERRAKPYQRWAQRVLVVNRTGGPERHTLGQLRPQHVYGEDQAKNKLAGQKLIEAIVANDVRVEFEGFYGGATAVSGVARNLAKRTFLLDPRLERELYRLDELIRKSKARQDEILQLAVGAGGVQLSAEQLASFAAERVKRNPGRKPEDPQYRPESIAAADRTLSNARIHLAWVEAGAEGECQCFNCHSVRSAIARRQLELDRVKAEKVHAKHRRTVDGCDHCDRLVASVKRMCSPEYGAVRPMVRRGRAGEWLCSDPAGVHWAKIAVVDGEKKWLAEHPGYVRVPEPKAKKAAA